MTRSNDTHPRTAEACSYCGGSGTSGSGAIDNPYERCHACRPRTETAWSPPFCANEIENLACPKCGEEAVRVREKETYFDGFDVEAYCAECHAELSVTVLVTVEFSDVEVVE